MTFEEKYKMGIIYSTIIMIFTLPIHIIIYKYFSVPFEMFFGIGVGEYHPIKYIIVWQMIAIIYVIAISITNKMKAEKE